MIVIAALVAVIASLVCRISRQRRETARALEVIRRELVGGERLVDSLVSIVMEIINTTAIGSSNSPLLIKRLKKNFCYKQSNLGSVVRDLPSLVDLRCYGLVSNLRRSAPQLSEKELLFCCLVALGMSPGCISFVFGFDSTNTVYNNSSRIRAKLGIRREVDIYSFMADKVERLRMQRQNLLDESIGKRSFAPIIENTDI